MHASINFIAPLRENESLWLVYFFFFGDFPAFVLHCLENLWLVSWIHLILFIFSESTFIFFTHASGDNIYFRFPFWLATARFMLLFFFALLSLAMGFFICVISMPFGGIDKKNVTRDKSNGVNAFSRSDQMKMRPRVESKFKPNKKTEMMPLVCLDESPARRKIYLIFFCCCCSPFYQVCSLFFFPRSSITACVLLYDSILARDANYKFPFTYRFANARFISHYYFNKQFELKIIAKNLAINYVPHTYCIKNRDCLIEK